tara:strand:+ start:147 stop:383 length:237 start_codon:yes stop_codon:yes gene_type:complete
MNLTEQQLASFKEKFANVIVNNMTLKECQELIFNQICNDFDSMSFDEIVENTLQEDMHVVDSLVKEVTSDDVNLNVQL